MSKVDFFICHASEDKETFVKDLAHQLIRNSATVFYDEYSIKLGDSLSQKINEGIVNANNGVIVLSNFFFEKKWTNAELQAIFNKSINENFKLFIIYHNIGNEDVRTRYPLLADIKATNSSKGFEKVAEELFKAAELKPTMGYATIPYTFGNGVKKEDGFNITMRISIPHKGEPRFPKIVFESGNPEYQHSRIRFIIKWNKRLYFEIILANYQTIGLSADIASWEIGEPHFILANCDTQARLIYLMVDENVVDTFEYTNLDFPDTFFEHGRGIIGCSLELDNPAPFTISHFSFGKSIILEAAKAYFMAIDKFNKTLNR